MARRFGKVYQWPYFHSAVFCMALLGLSAIAVAGLHFLFFHIIGVPPVMPGFVDARSILISLDLQAAGVDPISAKQYIYERGWLWIGGLLGLGSRNDLLVALIFDGLYAASVLILIQRIAQSTREKTWILVLALSPAAVLLLERANLDGLILGLIVLAVFAVPRCPAVAWTSVFFGFTMKLYPLFALLSFAILPRMKLIRYAGLSVVAVAVFLFFTRHDYGGLVQNVPQPIHISFGRPVPVQMIGAWSKLAGAVVNVLYFLCFIAAAGYGWAKAALVNVMPERRALAAFFAGAGIYLFSSLMAANYNYRLVFCLLCVPVLVRFTVKGEAAPLRGMAKYALWSLASLNWFMLFYHPTEHPWRMGRFAVLAPLNHGITALAESVGVISGVISFLLLTVLTAMLVRPCVEALPGELFQRQAFDRARPPQHS